MSASSFPSPIDGITFYILKTGDLSDTRLDLLTQHILYHRGKFIIHTPKINFNRLISPSSSVITALITGARVGSTNHPDQSLMLDPNNAAIVRACILSNIPIISHQFIFKLRNLFSNPSMALPPVSSLLFSDLLSLPPLLDYVILNSAARAVAWRQNASNPPFSHTNSLQNSFSNPQNPASPNQPNIFTSTPQLPPTLGHVFRLVDTHLTATRATPSLNTVGRTELPPHITHTLFVKEEDGTLQPVSPYVIDMQSFTPGTSSKSTSSYNRGIGPSELDARADLARNESFSNQSDIDNIIVNGYVFANNMIKCYGYYHLVQDSHAQQLEEAKNKQNDVKDNIQILKDLLGRNYTHYYQYVPITRTVTLSVDNSNLNNLSVHHSDESSAFRNSSNFNDDDDEFAWLSDYNLKKKMTDLNANISIKIEPHQPPSNPGNILNTPTLLPNQVTKQFTYSPAEILMSFANCPILSPFCTPTIMPPENLYYSQHSVHTSGQQKPKLISGDNEKNSMLSRNRIDPDLPPVYLPIGTRMKCIFKSRQKLACQSATAATHEVNKNNDDEYTVNCMENKRHGLEHGLSEVHYAARRKVEWTQITMLQQHQRAKQDEMLIKSGSLNIAQTETVVMSSSTPGNGGGGFSLLDREATLQQRFFQHTRNNIAKMPLSTIPLQHTTIQSVNMHCQTLVPTTIHQSDVLGNVDTKHDNYNFSAHHHNIGKIDLNIRTRDLQMFADNTPFDDDNTLDPFDDNVPPNLFVHDTFATTPIFDSKSGQNDQKLKQSDDHCSTYPTIINNPFGTEFDQDEIPYLDPTPLDNPASHLITNLPTHVNHDNHSAQTIQPARTDHHLTSPHQRCEHYEIKHEPNDSHQSYNPPNTFQNHHNRFNDLHYYNLSLIFNNNGRERDRNYHSTHTLIQPVHLKSHPTAFLPTTFEHVGDHNMHVHPHSNLATNITTKTNSPPQSYTHELHPSHEFWRFRLRLPDAPDVMSGYREQISIDELKKAKSGLQHDGFEYKIEQEVSIDQISADDSDDEVITGAKSIAARTLDAIQHEKKFKLQHDNNNNDSEFSDSDADFDLNHDKSRNSYENGYDNLLDPVFQLIDKKAQEVNESLAHTQQSHENLNEHLTKELELLETLYSTRRGKNDDWRSMGFRKAVGILRSLPYKVESARQVNELRYVPQKYSNVTNVEKMGARDNITPNSRANRRWAVSYLGKRGFGSTMATTCIEILKNGHSNRYLSLVSQEQQQYLTSLTSVHGIGPALAISFINKKFTHVLHLCLALGMGLIRRNNNFFSGGYVLDEFNELVENFPGIFPTSNPLHTQQCQRLATELVMQRSFQHHNFHQHDNFSDHNPQQKQSHITNLAPWYNYGFYANVHVSALSIANSSVRTFVLRDGKLLSKQFVEMEKKQAQLKKNREDQERLDSSDRAANCRDKKKEIGPYNLLFKDRNVKYAHHALYKRLLCGVEFDIILMGLLQQYTPQFKKQYDMAQKAFMRSVVDLQRSKQPHDCKLNLDYSCSQSLQPSSLHLPTSQPSSFTLTYNVFPVYHPLFLPSIDTAVLFEEYDHYIANAISYYGFRFHLFHPKLLGWVSHMYDFRHIIITPKKAGNESIQNHNYNGITIEFKSLFQRNDFIPKASLRTPIGIYSNILFEAVLREYHINFYKQQLKLSKNGDFDGPEKNQPIMSPIVTLDQLPPWATVTHAEQTHDQWTFWRGFHKPSFNSVNTPANPSKNSKKFGNDNTLSIVQQPVVALSKAQVVGLLFNADHQLRVRREEVTAVISYIQAVLKIICPDAVVLCCGSYRRGKGSSGDVDVFITAPSWIGQDESLLSRSLFLRCLLIALQLFNTPTFFTFENIIYLLLLTDPQCMSRFIIHLKRNTKTEWILQQYNILLDELITNNESKTTPKIPPTLSQFILDLFKQPPHDNKSNVDFDLRRTSPNDVPPPSHPDISEFTQFSDYSNHCLNLQDLPPSVPFITGSLRGYYPDPSVWCAGGDAFAQYQMKTTTRHEKIDLSHKTSLHLDRDRIIPVQLDSIDLGLFTSIRSLIFAELVDMAQPNDPKDRMSQCQLNNTIKLDTTWMGFCRLPPWHHLSSNSNIRIDLKLFPVETIPFALLYFTGSDHFNRSMRYYANRNGWSLSEHSLVPVVRGYNRDKGYVKTREGPGVFCQSEEDVFYAMQLEYVHPWDRNTYKS